jgi:hypothetical protein
MVKHIFFKGYRQSGDWEMGDSGFGETIEGICKIQIKVVRGFYSQKRSKRIGRLKFN